MTTRTDICYLLHAQGDAPEGYVVASRPAGAEWSKAERGVGDTGLMVMTVDAAEDVVECLRVGKPVGVRDGLCSALRKRDFPNHPHFKKAQGESVPPARRGKKDKSKKSRRSG